MTLRRTAVVLPVLVISGVGLMGSLAGVAATGGGGDRPTIGGWPEDRNGDGVISDHGNERIPDLIKAVGDDGTEGYVRYVDLAGPQPANPEEAVKMSGIGRSIPVYAADGTTGIGTYTLSGGDPSTPTGAQSASR